VNWANNMLLFEMLRVHEKAGSWALFHAGGRFLPEVDLVRDFSLLQKKIKFRVLGVLFCVIFGNKKTRNFTERTEKKPKKAVMPWRSG
jgi:hypothetical protein